MITRRRFPAFLTIAAMSLALLATSSFVVAKKPGGGGGGGNGGGGGQAAPPYSITFLGTLGGNLSVAEGMNNSNDVVGYSQTDIPWSFIDPETGQTVDGVWRHGFLNVDNGSGRTMIDLQSKFENEELIVPGFDYANMVGWYVQQAYDINNSGQIIGTMTHMELVAVGEGFEPRATERTLFLYSPADGSDPAHIFYFTGFTPFSINDVGDVVGYGTGSTGLTHPFVLWAGDTLPSELPLFEGNTTLAFDINDFGQVCGGNNPHYRALRYTPGSGYENLGSAFKGKHSWSMAYSINNSGQVACGSSGSSSSAAFRYSDETGLQKLGTLGGENSYCNGGGINNSGDMIGYSDTSDGKQHVFLYTDDLGMTDLEAAITNLPADLDGFLRSPGLLINDSGAVSGRVGDGTGSQPSLLGNTWEAYLLTPN